MPTTYLTRVKQSALGRVTLAGAPAGLVTISLFAVMAALIATDYTPAEAAERREIPTITPQEVVDPEVRVRTPLAPIKVASTPPPPPRLSVAKDDVNLPTPILTGAAPSDAGFQTVGQLEFSPVAISNRDIRPISPPLITYPDIALHRGLEGECEVRLNVDVRGRPFDVEASCTNSVFEREAERAVGRVEFVPMVREGRAVERRNIVYPLAFSLDK